MRKVVLLLGLACALVWASTAIAVTGYAGPRFWYAGDEAGSSYSSGWSYNDFNKPSSGYDTTVAFIDNVSYGWHATIRNRDMVTHTYWWTSQVKKGHCKAHTGGHWGGCYVY
jgi:nicotinamide mononucleotide (NMN) deamidase PncC